MAWHVQEQEEKVGKQVNIVKCKHVRMFPIEGAGGTTFGMLRFLCLRIIMRSDKGYELTLNLSTARGMNNPTFKVKHPKIVADADANVEVYDLQRSFESRMVALGGESLKNEIMGLFAERFVGMMRKAEKKAA